MWSDGLIIAPAAFDADINHIARPGLKAQHLIEIFLEKIKQYHAIATRADKLVSHFLSAIHLVDSVVRLN